MRHLSFTGSTAVGKYLHVECAKTFKKTSMELGGNALIVFENVNIQKVVDGMLLSFSFLDLIARLTSLHRPYSFKIPVIRTNVCVC